jgi:iron uptake system component EfeO
MSARSFLSSRLCALGALLAALSPIACSGTDNTKVLSDAEYEKAAIVEVKTYIQGHLDALYDAAVALEAAAPPPDADGWSAMSDAAAVAAMKDAWKKARREYESTEGAIAVIFPDLDISTDERYDGFIEAGPDDNLFDDTGVTGVHAIERVLWSDSIPDVVLEFESGLANYKPAAFPATEAEARDFKTKLCARFVADAKQMRDGFAPLALDASAAYRGVIGSLQEQIEKIDKAATGEEESRYAEFTLADMRENVAAGRATYLAFQEWLIARGGASVDASILAGFDRIEAGYNAVSGDSLPPLPEGWTTENPKPEHLDTPFGKLFTLLKTESDAAASGSLVSAMLSSADTLGIEPLD